MGNSTKNNCQKGYAEKLLAEVKGIDPTFDEQMEKGSYCGFEIFERKATLSDGGPVIGFCIWPASKINLDIKSMCAGRTGICDTIEDAKYFVDQILFMDYTFGITIVNLLKRKEKRDTRIMLSLSLENK